MKIPLILISGYLGSGKTTLLKHILKNTDKKIAILMNEFGEVGIDTIEIKKENIMVKELLEGCVCCSLEGELEAGLKEIIDEYRPDTIIVETTGIAEADNLVLEINNDLDFVSLDAVITVVDADVTNRFPEISGSAKIQIEAADLLLLNKIDLVDKEKLQEIFKKLREINNKASIIETEFCKVDLDILLSVEAEHHHIKRTEHHHHMESFVIEVKNLIKDKLEGFLNELSASIFRVKGYLVADDKNYLLNYVAGRWSLEKTDKTGNKLVFIGEKISKEKDSLVKKLESCFK
jgi:G3E family GTPase